MLATSATSFTSPIQRLLLQGAIVPSSDCVLTPVARRSGKSVVWQDSVGFKVDDGQLTSLNTANVFITVTSGLQPKPGTPACTEDQQCIVKLGSIDPTLPADSAYITTLLQHVSCLVMVLLTLSIAQGTLYQLNGGIPPPITAPNTKLTSNNMQVAYQGSKYLCGPFADFFEFQVARQGFKSPPTRQWLNITCVNNAPVLQLPPGQISFTLLQSVPLFLNLTDPDAPYAQWTPGWSDTFSMAIASSLGEYASIQLNQKALADCTFSVGDGSNPDMKFKASLSTMQLTLWPITLTGNDNGAGTVTFIVNDNNALDPLTTTAVLSFVVTNSQQAQAPGTPINVRLTVVLFFC